jgi:membrane fusion protein (multidrug efflux system)
MTHSLTINFNFMKSRIYTRTLIAVVIAGLLAACSAATPNDKKAQLDDLKKQQAEITKQIAQLESELNAIPDSTKTAKRKDVAVLDITPRKFDHYVQTQGSVEAEDNILVSAKSAGVVTQVYGTEGQQVSRGQVLAQIDNAVIRQNIEAMKSQLELANSIYNRQKNLWDQKIGTEVQYLEAKSKKEGLERQIASLEEQSDMAKIHAPISGTIDEVSAKVGQNLSPGMPAFRIVNTSNLKLKSRVSEAYVTDIKTGNRVTISIPELKKEIEGRVTFVGKNIDPLSRTFTVEVKLPSDKDLRPNMTATVKIIFHTESSALVVPINVIQTLNDEKILYVAEVNGKEAVARKKKVIVEGVFGSQAQVSGLKEGDKIITVGYQGLNDGDLIKL